MSSEDRIETALSEAKRLLTLFSLSKTDSSWFPAELGPILTHQLDAKLQHVLRETPDDPVSDLTGEWADEGATLRRLLSHENPPLVLLDRLKRIAKKASATPDGSVPKEVATVLYIAAIIVGQRCGHQLSQLDESSVHERASWAARRKWQDPMLREMFDAFLKQS